MEKRILKNLLFLLPLKSFLFNYFFEICFQIFFEKPWANRILIFLSKGMRIVKKRMGQNLHCLSKKGANLILIVKINGCFQNNNILWILIIELNFAMLVKINECCQNNYFFCNLKQQQKRLMSVMTSMISKIVMNEIPT